MSDTIHVEEAECIHRLPDGKPCQWATPLGPGLAERIMGHVDTVHPRRRVGAGREARAMLYRAAWIAIQEDGSRVTLRGQEFESLDKAIRDRDDANLANYVTEAWLERSEWQRFEP